MTNEKQTNRCECPFCKQPLEYDLDMQGMQVSCPSCSREFQLPGDAPVPATPKSAPPPLPSSAAEEKPKAKDISHKIPNGLGLVFAAIVMTIGGGGRMNAALLAFFAYLLGAGIGYAIEALRIGRTAKMVIASVVGILIGGGFLFNKAVSDVRQMQAQLDSGQTSSRAPTESQQSTSDQVLQAFPNMSAKAKRAFRQKVSGMSEDQTMAFLWQLMAEGETLFSDADKNEMTAFYWKAVETLTPEEQMFIQKVNLKLSQGQGYSAADQQKSSALVQKGFGNLSEKDNSRYLEMRGKAIELALLKPQAAARQYQSNYPPTESKVKTMTLEEKQQRIQEITAKAISLLPEKDRIRFLELQLTPADQLTKAQYDERVRYSEKIMTLLPEDEIKEMLELTADMLEINPRRTQPKTATQIHKGFEDDSVEQVLKESGMDNDLAEPLAEALQSVADKASRNGGISLEEIDEIAESFSESMRPVIGKPKSIPLDELREMAEQGDVNAQYQLGENYYSGKGVPKDYKEAVKWCKMAGEQGHPFAHSVLRAIAIDGKAISGEELFAWFKNQAEQGNVKAHFSIGVMYENGETVARNRKEAMKWLKSAAEQGDGEAKMLLNLMESGF